jgi:hypothetical protein
MASQRMLLTLLLSCATFLNAAGKSPFIGKWELDKNKTQATGAPEDFSFEIKQNGNSGIIVASKYREPRNSVYPLMWVGIMTYELPLSTDGSLKTNQIGPFAHVSKTTVNGNKMVTDWQASMDKGGVQGQWIRTVSPDGREMTLQVISKASDGRNMDQTLFFKRK